MAYAIEARQFWSNLRLNECIIVVVLRLQLNYSMVIVLAEARRWGDICTCFGRSIPAGTSVVLIDTWNSLFITSELSLDTSVANQILD